MTDDGCEMCDQDVGDVGIGMRDKNDKLKFFCSDECFKNFKELN